MDPILLVEDDESYGTSIKKILKDEGFEVLFVTKTSEAISIMSQRKLSLVISDLYIDNIDGIQLASIAKSIQPSINFMILTGLPSQANEYRALTENVDLFLEKKKPSRVITEYVKKLSSLTNNESNFVGGQVIVSKRENLVIDCDNNIVKRNGEIVSLTQTEYTILRLLLERKNELITRAELIKTIWGDEQINERTVDVHIKNIREKTRTFSIVSVHGKGYRWSE